MRTVRRDFMRFSLGGSESVDWAESSEKSNRKRRFAPDAGGDAGAPSGCRPSGTGCADVLVGFPKGTREAEGLAPPGTINRTR